MATLEKPKVKTKKTRGKEESKIFPASSLNVNKQKIEALEDASSSFPITENSMPVDFDLIKSTHTQSIYNEECITSSDNENQKGVDQMRGGCLPGQLALTKELAEVTTSTATAPVSDATTSIPLPVAPAENLPIVQYPNLVPLQHIEDKSEVLYQKISSTSSRYYFAKSKMKNLTSDQQKEIYDCAELGMAKQFELDFLMNSLLEKYENHPLYAALLEYWNLQSKLTVNKYDVEKAKISVTNVQAKIWSNVEITKTFSDRCRDNVLLSERVTYVAAHVNGTYLENTSAELENLYDLVCNTYAINLIAAKIIKVKIDQITDDIISPNCLIKCVQNEKKGILKVLDADLIPHVANLRRAISILFNFVRKLSPNKDFASDLKAWLRKLVALHLLIATKEDHWFLLFNILRCPNGIGDWATSFLQMPSQPRTQNITNSSKITELPMDLNSPEMNHCVSTLQILLLPIKKRNEYLQDMDQSHKDISDPAREERWILIDSDGEDCHNSKGECVGLKESDLIALLNQIPFEKIFISALKIEKFLNDYIISPDLISANDVLRVIIFFSRLVEIFGEGIMTYNIERYRQLAKRLGRLIRHTLQYSTDYYELFMHNEIPKDAKTCDRISVELNSLLFKACGYIYHSRKLSTWQYLSSLPFNSFDTEITWQMFYYLNTGFPAQLPTNQEDYESLINMSDFWKKFNIANADSSAEDLYFLLQAFFEMANARDRTRDWNMIKTICLHIFNIGFINVNTRDICYKTSRDMLVNLTLSNEDLITCILFQLKIRFNEIENCTYLIKSLPLENWKPGMESFEILSNWLLHFDYTSQENMIARIIISHLNWGLDYDGRLFLPHNIHVRMACLVTESLNKHAPEIIGLSGISESVRQVSSIIELSPTTKEQFATWCWTMVSLLRLHLMDLGTESIKRTLLKPTEQLLFVPELKQIEIIYQGVTENRPLAVYVAILVSLHGHTIPLICQQGLELIKSLINDYRYAPAIRCIELIVPLFLETPETLANCKSFHSILNSLLTADRSYLKVAKDIICTNSNGPVLELLDNMIHHQITSYTDYGLSTPMNLINAWLNLFTAFPNWQNTNLVYFLDVILRIAYQFSDARYQAVEFFHNYFKDCGDWKSPKKMFALKTLFCSVQSRIPIISPLHGWLALVLLEIEFKTEDAYFWSEFLRNLAVIDDKGCVESALKKTILALKITTTIPPEMLVIYKYANIIGSMDISHPVFPIMCQKFFELYLSRVPMACDEYSFGGVYGVSNKLYDVNVSLMKKVSSNLKAASIYFSNQASKCAAEESLSIFYNDCSKIMKSYELWLHDTTIIQHTKDDCNFPPQYNNVKLREILNGNTSHWTEFLYLPNIRKIQKENAKLWAQKCHRSQSIPHLRSPLQPKPYIDPVKRIKQHLSSYDACVEPPKYSIPTAIISNEITRTSVDDIKGYIKTINSMANKLYYDTSELNSLSRNYLDTIRNLYKMVPYDEIKYKSCNSLLFNRKCSGPARILTQPQRIQIDNEIKGKLQKSEERRNKILNGIIELNAEEFALGVKQLNSIMRNLTSSNSIQKSSVVAKTGIQFFYAIIQNLNDVTMKFQPANDLYSELLYHLNIFIQENQEKEGINILQIALKHTEMIKQLAAAFVPCRTSPESFLNMYQYLVESYLNRCDKKILFVLLSKFDLITWLETFQPKLNDIHNLLKLVLQGLECWAQSDSSLLQDQFRRHLVHIFEYDFPQHYGEVLQMVLDRISEQKLLPVILIDLLNSLLTRFNCKTMSADIKSKEIIEISIDFARRQNIFNFKGATDTLLLFAHHFQKERLNHGLHGLYPKHKDYCKPLSMWFLCIGHVLVVTAICTFQDLLADQISDVVFASIIELYSPWLVPYTDEILHKSSANWIRQLTVKDKMLSPWSEQHVPYSKIMIRSLMDILNFVLENLPVSLVTLTHIFGWYIHHFAITNIGFHIYANIHEGLGELPWEQFKPGPAQIDLFYESLDKFLPPTHALLGHIFIRVDWNEWLEEDFTKIPANMQAQVISRLFTIFVKISFEPNLHLNIKTGKILSNAFKYPWYMVNYEELENIFKWFVSSVDHPIILQMPTERNCVDEAVLKLLCLSCAMMPDEIVSWETIMQPKYYATAKRILYTRNYIRLLCITSTKNYKLIDTKDGTHAFNMAFMDLLNSIDKTIRATGSIKTFDEQNLEALNIMIEILLPMQTLKVETSNQLIETIIQWQNTCDAGHVLFFSTLSCITHMKTFVTGVYPLLESTIAHYFRISGLSKDLHAPNWKSLCGLLKMSIEKMNLMPILSGPYFLTLHFFLIIKFNEIRNIGDKITFLQDICQLVEGLKINPCTEPRLALVWGAIISQGCQILCENKNVKKVLLMFASSLCLASTQAEGWSDTLLGVIGLKTDNVTNKLKALARCFACVLYSLFPHTSSADTYPSDELELSLHELTILLANKKFTDIKPQIVTAIGIIKNRSRSLRDIPSMVCSLIGLFYTNDFLATASELWDFESRLT